MTVEKRFSELPQAASAQMSDIICAIQGYISPSNLGISSQETLQQIYNLFQSNIILFNGGDPNGVVAGTTYQFCWDTVNEILYICTSTGTATSAVWTQVSNPLSGIIPPDNGGTGVANPPIHTLPVAQGTADFNFLGPLTDGQLLIGSTGSDPVPATLTAGTNVTITNSGGGIMISATGSSTSTWNVVTGTTQLMVVNENYIANNVGLVTLTLPATAAVGSIISIQGLGAGGWAVAQNVSQLIRIGNAVTTTGIAGSISSTNIYDSLTLVCVVANTTWACLGGVQGNLTIV